MCIRDSCYTQLYDVEQEQNGLYTYDRKKKFSDEIYEKIKAANTSKAAIETNKNIFDSTVLEICQNTEPEVCSLIS